MNLRPSALITENQLNRGMNLVVADGLTAEAMVVFTSGTFLVALAVHMGASNFQIGLLGALPTFTTIFQLLSIWLIQKFNNRKLITATCNFLARLPIIAIGILPFIFSKGTTFQVLLMLLFFQHVFGDIAGASWNAWMKDLIPNERLGTYFSHRSRLAQILNVTLSIITAFAIDYVKVHYPAQEIHAYTILFLLGGLMGMMSVVFLLRTPEPQPTVIDEKLFKLFSKPLKNKNYRNLLVFNSFWAFALNLAVPFFTVFMMTTLKLPVSYIIGLGIASQLSSIGSLKLWGRYSDRFSNKTIISICAPLYILCIFTFAFVSMPSAKIMMLAMLLLIHIGSGIATAGINLALSNIGIKLAPAKEAIVYISAKNMMVALSSTIAPLVGGLMADFFASHQLLWNLQLQTGHAIHNVTLINLHGWNYFFIIGSVLAFVSLKFLAKVQEDGEVNKDKVAVHLRVAFRRSLRNNFPQGLAYHLIHPTAMIKRKMVNLFSTTNHIQLKKSA